MLTIFGVVRPGTDQAFALTLTEVGTVAMQAFLDRFAATLSEPVHAALPLDGAGWYMPATLPCRPTSASSSCRSMHWN